MLQIVPIFQIFLLFTITASIPISPHTKYSTKPSNHAITWPDCLSSCWTKNENHIPKTPNVPLCTIPFYKSMVKCAVKDCKENDQGVFTVLVTSECSDRFNVSDVFRDLVKVGGRPEDCWIVGEDDGITCGDRTKVVSEGAGISSSVDIKGKTTVPTPGNTDKEQSLVGFYGTTLLLMVAGVFADIFK